MFLFVVGSINLEETFVIMTDNHPHDRMSNKYGHKSIFQFRMDTIVASQCNEKVNSPHYNVTLK